MKNKIFTNTDENKFAREMLPEQSGLFLVKGSIKLDDTHLSLPDETFLVILTADVNGLLHSLVICSQGGFFDDVKVWSVEDGNNNVKTVAQTLTGLEVDTACKNLKFRDNYQNFFANKYSYEAVAKLSVKPNYHIFGNSCIDNTFGTNCYYTTLGNNCRSNTFGNDCVHNILGDGCSYNIFGKSLECSKIDSGVTYIELRSNASTGRSLKNIHILSGVRGKSQSERLVINIPDEYLKSSRELIITTKRTDGGPSTPEDIVMYYADEVAEMLDAIKYSYTPVPLTDTTSTNKTQLDLFLSKVPNAQVMHCTYNDVYAGTLHKINGSWYGVLVGESNTLAGQLSIKLQADGTIVEGAA
nr:MAG TPA: hypothetical protein [Caudoviricetes sp.]